MGILPNISDLLKPIKDLVSEVVVDKDKRDQVNLELKRLEDDAQARLDAQTTAQIEVNKVEASSGSVFVAGWRPFVGWVGGVGLAMQSIVLPLFAQFTGRMYEMNTELLIMTLGSMLGMGGLRSFEKVKGVSTNDYTATPSKAANTETEVTLASGDTISTKTTAPPLPVQPMVKKSGWKLF